MKLGFHSFILACSFLIVSPVEVTAFSPATPICTQTNLQIDEKSIVDLVSQAQKMYWQLQAAKTEQEAFTFKEQRYVYLTEDFSTREKLLLFLERVYTKEASEFFFDEAGYEIYKDKVTALYGDSGSLRAWDKAQATLVKETPSSKTFRVEVPIGDSTEIEEKFITVKQLPNLGWRIINSPSDIR
jgi:hypothetical protein